MATKGTCVFCQKSFSRSGIARHLASCKARLAAQADLTTKRGWHKARLLHLKIEGRRNPDYWMHVELPADAPFSVLDQFLRDTWLECCGHLSMFTVGKATYESEVEEPDFTWLPDPLGLSDDLLDEPVEEVTQDDDEFLAELEAKGRAEGMPEAMLQRYLRTMRDLLEEEENEHTMDVPLGEAIRPGEKFFHEYDFGTTTELVLILVDERGGKSPKKPHVTLLARNDPPEIMCGICHKKPAVVVCSYCSWQADGWLCADCAPQHACGPEAFLPVVNSPRVGRCGYTGDAGEDYSRLMNDLYDAYEDGFEFDELDDIP